MLADLVYKVWSVVHSVMCPQGVDQQTHDTHFLSIIKLKKYVNLRSGCGSNVKLVSFQLLLVCT